MQQAPRWARSSLQRGSGRPLPIRPVIGDLGGNRLDEPGRRRVIDRSNLHVAGAFPGAFDPAVRVRQVNAVDELHVDVRLVRDDREPEVAYRAARAEPEYAVAWIDFAFSSKTSPSGNSLSIR